MAIVILFNKPFNVLSQFTDKGNEHSDRKNLSEFVNIPNVYAAGRLDKDSEGLLVLTDDGVLQQEISNPKHKWPKTYVVQVEGKPTKDDIKVLQNGVILKDGITKPADVEIIDPKDYSHNAQKKEYAKLFWKEQNRKGYTLYDVERLMGERNYFASMMIKNGDADAMISGYSRNYRSVVKPILETISTVSYTHLTLPTTPYV